jgi:hypothetical protein
MRKTVGSVASAKGTTRQTDGLCMIVTFFSKVHYLRIRYFWAAIALCGLVTVCRLAAGHPLALLQERRNVQHCTRSQICL